MKTLLLSVSAFLTVSASAQYSFEEQKKAPYEDIIDAPVAPIVKKTWISTGIQMEYVEQGRIGLQRKGHG